MINLTIEEQPELAALCYQRLIVIHKHEARIKELEDALNTIHQINTGHTQDLYIDDVIEGAMKYDYGRMYE